MVLPGELSIGGPDLLLRRRLRHAEDRVVILELHGLAGPKAEDGAHAAASLRQPSSGVFVNDLDLAGRLECPAGCDVGDVDIRPHPRPADRAGIGRPFLHPAAVRALTAADTQAIAQDERVDSSRAGVPGACRPRRMNRGRARRPPRRVAVTSASSSSRSTRRSISSVDVEDPRHAGIDLDRDHVDEPRGEVVGQERPAAPWSPPRGRPPRVDRRTVARGARRAPRRHA